MDRLVARLRRRPALDENQSRAARLRRNAKLNALIYSKVHILQLLLFVLGYAWMIAIPLPELGQQTYHDENALQAGQVNTYWNWGDVHRADNYLRQLELLSHHNTSSYERAISLSTEFRKLGIISDTQSYEYSTSLGASNGTNVYAIISSPRASGTEAIVVSAPWFSRTGSHNLRGVATLISLAKFMKEYSLWAKDIIFVISDGDLEGMSAWLSAYHGSKHSNLNAGPLRLSSGVIWTALNIDYPGHSFSHLGIFFEGLNGRLPNQDLVNSFSFISRFTGNVPVILYDHLEPHEHPSRNQLPIWVPSFLHERAIEYLYRAKNIGRQVGFQARGQPSGVHGLFHQYRIDAFTMFAVPATGPHGFHAIGRILESTLRTANNLLERLHASFFFYILATPDSFLKIGKYLPSPILISVAMMFTGLRHWVDSAWSLSPVPEIETKSAVPAPSRQWVRRRRHVLSPLAVIVATHVYGLVLHNLISSSWYIGNQTTVGLAVFLVTAMGLASCSIIVSLAFPSTSSTNKEAAPTWLLLKSFNLCFASTIISVTSVLNFSLAALLAILLGVPLVLAAPSSNSIIRIAKYSAYVALALGWLILAPSQVRMAIANWQILGVWFAPFVTIIYAPLVLQAAVVCMLS